MAQDSDDTIRAKLLKTMDRKGFYYPSRVQLENLASMAPVASSDEGRAEELAHQMARDESFPVRYVEIDRAVCLEVDSQRWTAARMRSLDPDQLEWSQQQRLNGK
jgi:hypothetical protein